MGGGGEHVKGLAIVTLGVLILTPDTLLIRLIATDHWTLLAWRGPLQSLGLTLILLAVYRGGVLARFRAIGGAGLLTVATAAAAMVLFVVAVAHTSVANALVIVASAPFFAAVASRLFLGERIARRTWIAILVALCGIALLSLESLGRGTLVGDLAALGTALAMGLNFTIVRARRTINMIPAMALAGLLVGLAVNLVQPPQALDQTQTLLVLVMGLLVVPVSFALLTLGPRYIPAPEVGLLLLLETVIGPFWVWLAIGEAPGALALAGGALVVATLATHSALALRRARHGRDRTAPG